MRVGTKSLLFGVHQFLYHPYVVARAWRFLHGRWPNFPEWVCIFCHDLGYWGCPNMDGDLGQRHPEFGAKIAGRIMYNYARWRGHTPADAEFFRELYIKFTLFHSRFYAKRAGAPVSELFMADKLSIAFEPRWWYLLRATLSGEIKEYLANAQKHLNLPNPMPKKEWHHWYERKVISWLANPPK